MKKSELRQMIREMLKEELVRAGSKTGLTESPDITNYKLEKTKDYMKWAHGVPPKTYTKTFGSKTYDFSDISQINAWVKANLEFQMKRYPNKYTDETAIKMLRDKILKNLFERLRSEGVDARIIASIADRYQFNTARDNRDTTDTHHNEANKIISEIFNEFVNAYNKHCTNMMSDKEKSDARSVLAKACFDIIEKNNDYDDILDPIGKHIYY